MNVTEIVAAYLREHGYSGLYDPECAEGCGCTVDDLRPCDEDMSGCKPGYRCTIIEEHRFEGIGPVRDVEVKG